MAKAQLCFALFFICLFLFCSGVFTATFTIINRCTYTVWPGILSGAGTPPLSPTGFTLQSGESTAISVPTSWSGRLWGRTVCSTDPATGKFVCATGDCGSGALECSGAGALPPATLAEFTLNGADGLDFYDVSLVDGYNLPMLISPQGAGNCTITGCVVDLNLNCPSELQLIGEGSYASSRIACKSACEAFGDPWYCCSGAYGSPQTCKPSSYSGYFKSACPCAYSYAYDDGSSTFTCASADYLITFCPSSTKSQKSSGGQNASGSKGSLATSAGNMRSNFSFSVSGFVVFFALSWWYLW